MLAPPPRPLATSPPPATRKVKATAAPIVAAATAVGGTLGIKSTAAPSRTFARIVPCDATISTCAARGGVGGGGYHIGAVRVGHQGSRRKHRAHVGGSGHCGHDGPLFRGCGATSAVVANAAAIAVASRRPPLPPLISPHPAKTFTDTAQTTLVATAPSTTTASVTAGDPASGVRSPVPESAPAADAAASAAERSSEYGPQWRRHRSRSPSKVRRPAAKGRGLDGGGGCDRGAERRPGRRRRQHRTRAAVAFPSTARALECSPPPLGAAAGASPSSGTAALESVTAAATGRASTTPQLTNHASAQNTSAAVRSTSTSALGGSRVRGTEPSPRLLPCLPSGSPPCPRRPAAVHQPRHTPAVAPPPLLNKLLREKRRRYTPHGGHMPRQPHRASDGGGDRDELLASSWSGVPHLKLACQRRHGALPRALYSRRAGGPTPSNKNGGGRRGNGNRRRKFWARCPDDPASILDRRRHHRRSVPLGRRVDRAPPRESCPHDERVARGVDGAGASARPTDPIMPPPRGSSGVKVDPHPPPLWQRRVAPCAGTA